MTARGAINGEFPAVGRVLASHYGLQVVVQHREHGQTTVLDLYTHEPSNGGRVISQTQGIKSSRGVGIREWDHGQTDVTLEYARLQSAVSCSTWLASVRRDMGNCQMSWYLAAELVNRTVFLLDMRLVSSEPNSRHGYIPWVMAATGACAGVGASARVGTRAGMRVGGGIGAWAGAGGEAGAETRAGIGVGAGPGTGTGAGAGAGTRASTGAGTETGAWTGVGIGAGVGTVAGPGAGTGAGASTRAGGN